MTAPTLSKGLGHLVSTLHQLLFPFLWTPISALFPSQLWVIPWSLWHSEFWLHLSAISILLGGRKIVGPFASQSNTMTFQRGKDLITETRQKNYKSMKWGTYVMKRQSWFYLFCDNVKISHQGRQLEKKKMKSKKIWASTWGENYLYRIKITSPAPTNLDKEYLCQNNQASSTSLPHPNDTPRREICRQHFPLPLLSNSSFQGQDQAPGPSESLSENSFLL